MKFEGPPHSLGVIKPTKTLLLVDQNITSAWAVPSLANPSINPRIPPCIPPTSTPPHHQHISPRMEVVTACQSLNDFQYKLRVIPLQPQVPEIPRQLSLFYATSLEIYQVARWCRASPENTLRYASDYQLTASSDSQNFQRSTYRQRSQRPNAKGRRDGAVCQ